MEEKKKRAYSEAQGRATAKWLANNYYRVNVNFPIAERQMIQDAAAANNLSVSAFIAQAVYDKLKR